jgi:hypothetical protein
MNPLVSTLVHTLELTVVLGAAWVAVSIFGGGSEVMVALTAIVLGALAKFARASDGVPVKDYVNE